MCEMSGRELMEMFVCELSHNIHKTFAEGRMGEPFFIEVGHQPCLRIGAQEQACVDIDRSVNLSAGKDFE